MLVTSSLVGWWRFEGNANDSSGKGNNGTVYGSSLDTGKFGRCYSFDGVDDYVEVPDSASLKPTKISVAAWVKPFAFTAGAKDIIARRNTSNIGGFVWRGFDGSGLLTLWFYRDGIGWENVKVTLVANVWNHVVGTYDGANIRAYLNAVETSPTAVSGLLGTPTTVLRIGADAYALRDFFKGLIDEVRIYNRALLIEEILKHTQMFRR